MEAESVWWDGPWRGRAVVGILGAVWWWWRRVAVSRAGRGTSMVTSWNWSRTVSSGYRLGRMWRVVEAVAWASVVGIGEGSAHFGDAFVGIVEVNKLGLWR